jgi:hypothetical protein
MLQHSDDVCLAAQVTRSHAELGTDAFRACDSHNQRACAPTHRRVFERKHLQRFWGNLENILEEKDPHIGLAQRHNVLPRALYGFDGLHRHGCL